MSGLPLNHQLTERGARLARKCAHRARTTACSRSPNSSRRGRAWCATTPGAPIEVEVWEVPASTFGSFVDGIPAPLGIGTVTLDDGQQVKGFLCEAHATKGAREITSLGSWRQFIKGG